MKVNSKVRKTAHFNRKPKALFNYRHSTKQRVFPAKMLLDLGNSDALWLFPNRIPNFNYNRPNIDDFLEEDLMETSMENAVEYTP